MGENVTDAERIENQERTIMSLRLHVSERDRIIANLKLQNRTMQHAIEALRREVGRTPERLFR